MNRDGQVNAGDRLDVRRRLRHATTNVGSGPEAYTVFHDASADGAIGAQDVVVVGRNLLETLPSGEPSPAGVSAVGAALRRDRFAPITRTLLDGRN